MERFHRIYRLHQCLSAARLPVPRRTLEERLECSSATVKRIIQDMRDSLNAPIEYDRERNGYHYRKPGEGEPSYELPGMWFQPDELHALLTAQHLLARLQPGLFDALLAPLRGRIQGILAAGAGADGARSAELGRRVRVLPMAARKLDASVFTTVADALLGRARLAIDYRGRASDQPSERAVSPQRLVHYRENWYLDAWCHRADDLRIFALDRIARAERLAEAAHEVEDAELDRRVTGSYGIFGGVATETAVLRFDPEAARWVADEQWHPAQQGAWLADGRFELRVPYGIGTELVRDVLRWMPLCEVVSPPALRASVASAVREAAARYRD